VRELVDGKTVAIIGNAQSYVKCGLSSMIDAHETVIRINRIPKISEELGRKTTILTYNSDRVRVVCDRTVRPVLVHSLNVEGYEETPRPSSGMRVVYSLVNHYTPKSLTLYGFDFMQTASAYSPDRRNTPHQFDVEGKLIEEYETNGLLEIYRV